MRSIRAILSVVAFFLSIGVFAQNGEEAPNISVNPRLHDSTVMLELAPFMWQAHEDGLEFAIAPNGYEKSPHFEWSWGFRVGVGYAMERDGWDIGLKWTHFRTKAHRNLHAEDGEIITPLWSGFASPTSGSLFCTSSRSHLRLKIDMIDLELSREYWISRWLELRPYVGLRGVRIHQTYEIHEEGGSWSVPAVPLMNIIHLHSNFKGVGIRGGLDSIWEFGRGFGAYANAAMSLIYGRFEVGDREKNQQLEAPFSEFPVLHTNDGFRSSKAITDLGMGVQWLGYISQKRYVLLISLGWEQHLFLNMNQFWQVTRISTTQNIFDQRSGDLSTQGWTLSIKFDF